jgi:hypothetical protein
VRTAKRKAILGMVVGSSTQSSGQRRKTGVTIATRKEESIVIREVTTRLPLEEGG